jgi:hypothetical protein
MNVDGRASGHPPWMPDGHGPPQDGVGQLRECEPKAIMTPMYHLNPAGPTLTTWGMASPSALLTKARRHLKTGVSASAEAPGSASMSV